MIRIEELAMEFGERVLFAEANLNLNEGCRYGITGAKRFGEEYAPWHACRGDYAEPRKRCAFRPP